MIGQRRRASGHWPATSGTRRPKLHREGSTLTHSFDGVCRQSAMCLDNPDKLVFSYTRMMMGFLLFQPMPRDTLIIGLGGRS